MSVNTQKRVATASQSLVAEEVTDADVLTRAADILEEFEWCQGLQGSRAAGELCLFGALYEATVDCRGDWNGYLDDGVSDAIASVCGTGGTPLGGWNDRPERTKAEVVAKLREAARLASATANAEAVASRKGGS